MKGICVFTVWYLSPRIVGHLSGVVTESLTFISIRGFPYFLGVLVGFSDFHIFLFFVLATSSSITAFFVVSLQVLTLRLKNEEIIDLLTTQFLGDLSGSKYGTFYKKHSVIYG